MRKSITLFDDQYAFYKELKSEKLLVAFVEFMFEDIEPQGLNSMEQVIRNSLLERMNNWKGKSIAGSKSKGGGRPKKTNEGKQQKNNKKTTKKQQVKEEVKVKDKEEVKVKDKEEDKENIILKNDTETKVSEYGNKEINEVIFLLKEECNKLGVAYDKQKERQYAKNILTGKEFGRFCEKIGQSRIDFSLNILRASMKINYWKGICSGPMRIYLCYTDVYNETVKLHNKNSKNLIQSF